MAGILCHDTAEAEAIRRFFAENRRFQGKKKGDTPKRTSDDLTLRQKNGVQVFFSAPLFYRREFKSL